MAHIHTDPGQHDFTASAYIVRDDMDEPRILLHMHKKLHRLLQPGGHVELNEHLWGSIVHELQEETGYSLDELYVLQPKLRIEVQDRIILHPQPLFVNTHAFPELRHSHIDSGYLFLAHAAPSKPPAEDESTDLRWLSRSELEQLPAGLVYEDTRAVCVDVLTRFIGEWEPVPASSFGH